YRAFLELEVASPLEPDRWYKLQSLWLALTGERPDPELEGGAMFFRDHYPEIVMALGPHLERTKSSYAEWKKECQDHYVRWAGELRRQQPPLLRLWSGPVGWIIAVVLLFWILHNAGG